MELTWKQLTAVLSASTDFRHHANRFANHKYGLKGISNKKWGWLEHENSAHVKMPNPAHPFEPGWAKCCLPKRKAVRADHTMCIISRTDARHSGDYASYITLYRRSIPNISFIRLRHNHAEQKNLHLALVALHKYKDNRFLLKSPIWHLILCLIFNE